MNHLPDMNTQLLDVYDPSDQPMDQSAGQQQSLNEEVTQVVGQLGRLWGSFKKQSVTALESAKKVDLGSVVTQAQKELTWLVSENPYPDAKTAPTGSSTIDEKKLEDSEITEKALKQPEPEVASSGESIDGKTDGSTTPSAPSSPKAVDTTNQNFLARLQSSLPPNLASTVQSHLPDSLKHTDLAQLRTTLASEFARVQGVTRAQAEDYAAKSQGLLREAVTGGREFFKDAVRLVPPDEAVAQAAAARATAGLGWDGADAWMMDIALGTGLDAGTGSKGKEREVDWSSPREARKAVATRAQAILRRLKCDPDVLRADPEKDEAGRELYKTWVEKEVSSAEGGIGGAKWAGKIGEAMSDPADGETLKSTHDTLVPSEIAQETFWTRYFFRVYQVQREEERRKAIIQSSIKEEDDDFAWEDDEDEAQTPARADKPELPVPTAAKEPAPQPATAAAAVAATLETPTKPATSHPPSQVATPANTSPRHSSEGSYDVVSSNVSNAGEIKPARPVDAKKAAGSDDEDEDEDDEDEDDSDWE